MVMINKSLLKNGVLSAALAFSTLAFTQISFAADLPKTELTVVGTWSHLSQYKNFEQPFWANEIKEKSGGAIEAKVQGFNDMGLKGAEVVRLMRKGVIDFGSTILGYLAADDPINEAIDLAGLSPDMKTARAVTEAFKPVLEKKYLDAYGVKLLGIWPYSAQVLFCNAPISGLADLKGLKVRTANRTLAEFVGALGGTGVTMAFGEVVLGLQNKVVDCAITGSLSGYSAKWYEVSTHIYELPVGWSQVMHAVSLKKWNSLDPKVQEFLQTNITDLENRIWESAAEETVQGINCNTGKGDCKFGEPAKMEFIPISEQDRTKLKEVLNQTVLPRWFKRCGDACADEWKSTVGKVAGL
jgi:TRAP-type C4-dicarboxylate transport system substrate-binding protein